MTTVLGVWLPAAGAKARWALQLHSVRSGIVLAASLAAGVGLIGVLQKSAYIALALSAPYLFFAIPAMGWLNRRLLRDEFEQAVYRQDRWIAASRVLTVVVWVAAAAALVSGALYDRPS